MSLLEDEHARRLTHSCLAFGFDLEDLLTDDFEIELDLENLYEALSGDAGATDLVNSWGEENRIESVHAVTTGRIQEDDFFYFKFAETISNHTAYIANPLVYDQCDGTVMSAETAGGNWPPLDTVSSEDIYEGGPYSSAELGWTNRHSTDECKNICNEAASCGGFSWRILPPGEQNVLETGVCLFYSSVTTPVVDDSTEIPADNEHHCYRAYATPAYTETMWVNFTYTNHTSVGTNVHGILHAEGEDAVEMSYDIREFGRSEIDATIDNTTITGFFQYYDAEPDFTYELFIESVSLDSNVAITFNQTFDYTNYVSSDDRTFHHESLYVTREESGIYPVKILVEGTRRELNPDHALTNFNISAFLNDTTQHLFIVVDGEEDTNGDEQSWAHLAEITVSLAEGGFKLDEEPMKLGHSLEMSSVDDGSKTDVNLVHRLWMDGEEPMHLLNFTGRDTYEASPNTGYESYLWTKGSDSGGSNSSSETTLTHRFLYDSLILGEDNNVQLQTRLTANEDEVIEISVDATYDDTGDDMGWQHVFNISVGGDSIDTPDLSHYLNIDKMGGENNVFSLNVFHKLTVNENVTSRVEASIVDDNIGFEKRLQTEVIVAFGEDDEDNIIEHDFVWTSEDTEATEAYAFTIEHDLKIENERVNRIR